MRKKIFSPDQSLTFSDYFRLNLYVEDVAEYFGYEFARESMNLPRKEIGDLDLNGLIVQLKKTALRVGLTSEIGLREFFIAPVLVKLLEFTETEIRPEYWLEVDHQLKGTFDYLLENKNSFVVIEAKNGELRRGFTQLAAEMIALDKANDNEQKVIYGAITIGEVWRFGKLIRDEKKLSEDINLFRVPSDLPNLMEVLIGVLENEN